MTATPQPSFSGIHHVGISTPDLDRLATFYCDLFGFVEVERLAWEGGTVEVDALMALEGSAGVTALLRLGSTHLELFEFSQPGHHALQEDRPVSHAGFNQICIATNDVAAAYSRLKEAGMRFHGPPTDLGDGRPIAYGRDPDGNVVEIWQIEMTEP